MGGEKSVGISATIEASFGCDMHHHHGITGATSCAAQVDMGLGSSLPIVLFADGINCCLSTSTFYIPLLLAQQGPEG